MALSPSRRPSRFFLVRSAAVRETYGMPTGRCLLYERPMPNVFKSTSSSSGAVCAYVHAFMIKRISAAVADWFFPTPRNKLESEETHFPVIAFSHSHLPNSCCSLRDPFWTNFFLPGTPVAVAHKPSPPCLAAGGARADLSLRFTVSAVGRDAMATTPILPPGRPPVVPQALGHVAHGTVR